MEKLILEVGKTYLNSNDKYVTIIRAYDEESAEYIMGYRFRGDNGFSYTEDGHNQVVFGNGIHHQQKDSYPLVAEVNIDEITSNDYQANDTTMAYIEALRKRLALEELPQEEDTAEEESAQTNFYRNGLGKIVLIVAELAPEHKLYKKGYRFVDHRGTYYTHEGSTQWSIYKSLDLVEKVHLYEISEEEKQRLRKEGDSWLLWAAKKYVNFADLYCHTEGTFLIAHGAVLVPFTVAGAVIDTAFGISLLALNKYAVRPFRDSINADHDGDVDLHLQA